LRALNRCTAEKIFFLPLLKLAVKTLLELSYILKKNCIPRIFIVINVCNQGKTFCPHCSPFERVEEFKYFGTTLTNQYTIQAEFKNRLKTGNACYHSVQNFCLPVCYPKISSLNIQN
jgi:hypothetical protein